MKYSIIALLFIFASCGKTIKDPAFKSTSTISFDNQLSSDVRMVLFDYGIVLYDTIIDAGKTFEVNDEGSDGSGSRFFYSYDSAHLSISGIAKTDINYPGLKITALASDTINIFNPNRHTRESLGKNNTKYKYYINEKDSLEMK